MEINYNNIILDNTEGINLHLEGEEITNLIDSCRNEENILSRIALTNSENDTIIINFYQGFTKINENEPIKEISSDFCDNILLFYIDEIKTEYVEGKEIKKAKHCEAMNLFICDFLQDKGSLKRMTDFKAKLKRMIKNEVKYEEMLTYNEKYSASITDPKQLVKQVIKISLSNVEINTVFNIFSTENMRYLNENLVFFYDIDYTKDIAGAFLKKDLINFMLQKEYIHIFEESNKKEHKKRGFRNRRNADHKK